MSEFSIKDVFHDETLISTSDGYKMECPNCGLQGGRTHGFTLYENTNRWFCFASQSGGNILEAIAVKFGFLQCKDFADGQKPLKGQYFRQTIETLHQNYSKKFADWVMSLYDIKKTIHIPSLNHLISDFASEVGNEFGDSNIFFFREKLNQVVEIQTIEDENGSRTSVFVELTPSRFVTQLEIYFRPVQVIETKHNGPRECEKSIGIQTAKISIDSEQFQGKLPKIVKIFTAQLPVLKNDKIVLANVGYDAQLRSWMSTNAPKISYPNMTLEKAKEIIQYIYAEFCFDKEQDKTNAIAGLLTPMLRGLFSKQGTRTPIFFYLANRERAGKDYLAGITGLVYEGYAPEEPAISSDFTSKSNEDEIRKKILAYLIQGRKRIHFANNKGMINSSIFEGVTTAQFWNDRILGKSQTVEFVNELEFSLSGNVGVRMTPDLANRSRIINLFLEIEDANAREFKNPDLHKYVKDNQEVILSALYTFIRVWDEKGRPKSTIPFASYPEWASICGGIMECCDLGNPCTQNKEILGIANDEQTEMMKVLFEICFEDSPDIFLEKKQIIDIIKKSEDSSFEWIDWENNSHRVKFAKNFEKYVGRILSNIKLYVDDVEKRADRRKYKFVNINHINIDKSTINPQKDGRVVGCGRDMPVILIESKKNQHIEVIGKNLPNPTTLPNKQKDRKTHFLDADETQNIILSCTKDQILDYIQKNPNYSRKELYDKFGTGCFKLRNELKKEGIIK